MIGFVGVWGEGGGWRVGIRRGGVDGTGIWTKEAEEAGGGAADVGSVWIRECGWGILCGIGWEGSAHAVELLFSGSSVEGSCYADVARARRRMGGCGHR